MATFNIEDSTLYSSKEDKRCLVIADKIKQKQFCPLGVVNAEDFKNEWSYDFSLFKHQCKTEKPVISLDDNEQEKLDEEYQRKIVKK